MRQAVDRLLAAAEIHWQQRCPQEATSLMQGYFQRLKTK